MVMVSHLHKFIFLKTHKAAGTSIEMYLEPFCAAPGRVVKERTKAVVSAFGVVGQRMHGGHPELGGAFAWQNHSYAKAVKQELGRDIWRGYTKLTAVRNPFDRMVSAYYWRNRKEVIPDDQPFAETRALFRAFVLSEAMTNDAPIVHIKERFIIDDAVRYENMLGDLTRLGARLGYDPAATALPLTKETVSQRHGRAYWDYYEDDATVQSVRKQLAWVFEHYDYPTTPEPVVATTVVADSPAGPGGAVVKAIGR